jgi:hypothetical protein
MSGALEQRSRPDRRGRSAGTGGSLPDADDPLVCKRLGEEVGDESLARALVNLPNHHFYTWTLSYEPNTSTTFIGSNGQIPVFVSANLLIFQGVSRMTHMPS